LGPLSGENFSTPAVRLYYVICGRVFWGWLVQEGLERLFLPVRVGLRVAVGAVLGF